MGEFPLAYRKRLPEVRISANGGGAGRVTVLGGNGFVGAHVVRSFVERGYQVRSASRRGASAVASAGRPGVEAVRCDVRDARSVEDALRGVDGAGSALVIKGDATPADMTGDGKVDRLMNGLWEGTFRIGGGSAALARPDQKFLGERVTTP